MKADNGIGNENRPAGMRMGKALRRRILAMFVCLAVMVAVMFFIVSVYSWIRGRFDDKPAGAFGEGGAVSIDGDGNVVEKGRKIIVRMPQKQVFEAIKEIQDVEEENATVEDTEAIYRLLAAVLNNNMNRVRVTEKDLEDYDIEECTAILEAYMSFVDELKTNPN